MVLNVLLVMLGGFIGSMLRYGLGEWVQSTVGFPIGTFVINILGCFALGLLLTYFTIKDILGQQFSLFLGTGLIGSFTTFSTFSVETIMLIDTGLYEIASMYVIGSIVLGIGMAYVGMRLVLLCKREESVS